jgi:cytochrome c-type biogenesis protein CcmH
MTLWLILTMLIAAAAAFVALPFLRRSEDGRQAGSDVDVYKDQLAEVERDKEQGLIDEKEADLARVEIERRILSAARSDETAGQTVSAAWQYRTAMGVATIVVIGSVGLYATIGRPDLLTGASHVQMAAVDEGQTAAQPAQDGGSAQSVGDVTKMVKRLEKRLEDNPDNADGWRMLGWSYYNMGRYDDSVKAYARAVALQEDNPMLKALMGEAMVTAAGGKVTDKALKTFEEVLAINPKDERARFFKGVAKVQKGDNKGALDEWIALYKIAPADAQWAKDLRSQIDQLAQSSGIDVSDRLSEVKTAEAAPATPAGPSAQDVEAAKQLSGADQKAMVKGMVARLASRLKDSPEDADGWIMLIRSRMVLNQPEEARTALEQAKEVFSDAPETQTRIAQAAKAMGVR